MFDPETDETDSRQPAFTPDTFAATRSLIDLILNPKDFRTCLSSLERKLAAVARAEKRSAATVAAADEYAKTKHAEADKIIAEVTARENAASTAEWHLAEREKRINELEDKWRFVGESELVQRGFQAPAHTALQKARAAHGLSPTEAPSPDEPLPPAAREDRHGASFPDGVTLTRQPARRATNV